MIDLDFTAAPAISASDDAAPHIDALTRLGGYRVLRQVMPISHDPGPYDLNRHAIGLAIDTETTGLSHDGDKIIELSVVPFQYDRETGRIMRSAKPYSGYEDPGVPLSDEIKALTGIRDEDVAGKKLSDATVQAFAAKAVVCISHNAAFDRGFMEARFPFMTRMPWLCSNSGFDWKKAGFGSSKLDYLVNRAGYFHDGHRAEIDVHAMLNLLRLEFDGASIFSKILDRGRQSSYRLFVINAPFATKDALKAAGFFWNDPSNPQGRKEWPKAWHKEILADEWPAVNELLGAIPCRLAVGVVNALSRYTARHEFIGSVQRKDSIEEMLAPPARPAGPGPA